jgi:microcystin-dependent protein
MAEGFVGEIRLVGFNFPPNGWSLCSGQILSIAQNETLFVLIGTTYGGDGQTTYSLPDLRGRLAIGAGTGLSTYVQGQSFGSESASILTSNMPAHTHAITGGVAVATTVGVTNLAGDKLGGNNHVLAVAEAFTSPPVGVANYSDQAPNGNLGGVSSAVTSTLGLGPTGGNLPVSIEQPFLVMNYVISLFGVFPSRN